MANWKKLDAEFYKAIENMTNETWIHWKQNESKEQNLRQKKMQDETFNFFSSNFPTLENIYLTNPKTNSNETND